MRNMMFFCGGCLIFIEFPCQLTPRMKRGGGGGGGGYTFHGAKILVKLTNDSYHKDFNVTSRTVTSVTNVTSGLLCLCDLFP